MLRLEGKTAIITGAGRGIGKAIAHKFLLEGARVLICDIVPERLEETTLELQAFGEVQCLVGDVSQSEFCGSVVQTALEVFGEINILVNNAGIAVFARFLEHSEQAWDQTLNVNLKSMFLLSQRVARQMVAKGGGGAIVNMASTNGLLGERDLVAYNASKGGVILLTKTLAIELAEHNIRVNCVAPGLIRTTLAAESGSGDTFFDESLDKIPMRRLGTPQEVANVFAFLASDEASFITGETIVIDGGQLAEE
jgi:3-oxoacyl-[acyl-carrier protein] reductase